MLGASAATRAIAGLATFGVIARPWNLPHLGGRRRHAARRLRSLAVAGRRGSRGQGYRRPIFF